VLPELISKEFHHGEKGYPDGNCGENWKDRWICRHHRNSTVEVDWDGEELAYLPEMIAL